MIIPEMDNHNKMISAKAKLGFFIPKKIIDQNVFKVN